MFDKKAFWLVNNVGLSLFYLVALGLLINGQGQHWAVILVALILVAHVLEVPYALHVLKDKAGSKLRIVLGTVLFGFTWWLPAKKGIYSV